jgi:hypothetical protein
MLRHGSKRHIGVLRMHLAGAALAARKAPEDIATATVGQNLKQVIHADNLVTTKVFASGRPRLFSAAQ